MANKAAMPLAFGDLITTPARYKVYYGGRGGGKSHAFAIALVSLSLKNPLRILCTREFQNSIADSVHRLIVDKIELMGLNNYFDITQTAITSAKGSQFIFKGLQRSINEIKSTEGIDICWVEEAQTISERSWEILIPTVRKEKSELWISFNPENETDPTYQRFVVAPPPDSIIKKVNWDENPLFPEVLEKERQYMLRVDPEAYQHVWEGFCRTVSDAQIFKGKYEVGTFDQPADQTRYYYGADWGFSQDPTALIRCFIQGENLYIDQEAYGIGVEIDDLPKFFQRVPGAQTWPIRADSARPETISHVKRRGFNVTAADKWSGSVEDGIAVLKSFNKIIIHERCKHTAEEFRLYSYKIDKQTEEILPIVVDKHNHCIAKGELVATNRGEIPIEQIVPGDMALTRNGFRKVLFAGITGKDRKILEIKTSNHSIKCTPEHKIFFNNKFDFADSLRYGDCITLLPKETRQWLKQSSIKEKFLDDTRKVTTFQITNILNDLGKIINRQFFYTGLFGRTPSAQSLKDVLFTILMEIQGITTQQTLYALQPNNMPININGRLTDWNSNQNTWKKFDLLQKNGIQVKKDAKNIEKLAHWLTKTLSQLKKIVFNASNGFLQKRLDTKISSVQTNVNLHGDEHRELMILLKLARYAKKILHRISTPKLSTVQESVLKIQDAGISDVYDLTIDGDHEFFVNGVLVHNCIDAIRYALCGVIKSHNIFDACVVDSSYPPGVVINE